MITFMSDVFTIIGGGALGFAMAKFDDKERKIGSISGLISVISFFVSFLIMIKGGKSVIIQGIFTIGIYLFTLTFFMFFQFDNINGRLGMKVRLWRNKRYIGKYKAWRVIGLLWIIYILIYIVACNTVN